MMLNRRLTGALAWGGLILILAVPSAEMLSAKVDPNAGSTAAPVQGIDPLQTASIGTAKDPVDGYLATGKPLPDYISGGSAAVKPLTRVIPATAPVATETTHPEAVVVTPAAVETAAIPPVATLEPAPIPMPARMRPLPAPVTEPVPMDTQTAALSPAPASQLPAVTSAGTPVAAPDQTAAAPGTDAPVILDESTVLANEASTQSDQPALVPPANIPNARVVTEQDLADWDSGSLEDYLQRRGLISDASTDTGQGGDNSSATDQNDGFYLSDGPQAQRYGKGDSFVVFPND